MKLSELKENIDLWEKERSRREKVLILLISILLPIFLFYKLYYEARQERIIKLKDEIKNIELDIAKYESYVKKEKEVEFKLKEREKFLKEVQEILLTEEEIPQLLKDISKLIKKNKLELLIFSPKIETERDYYNEITVEIQIKGNYKDIINFLNDITRIQRVVNINKMEFTSSEGEEKIVFKGTIVTYKFTGKLLQTKNKI